MSPQLIDPPSKKTADGHAPVSAGELTITNDTLAIRQLTFTNADIAYYLGQLDPDERIPALIKTIEVGTFCMERAAATKDLDFVKRQVDRIITDIQSSVGGIPETVNKELLGKIGTGDGQVLKPLHDSTGAVAKVLGEKLTEVRNMLADDLDPSKDNSSLGKALKELKNLLDPARTDSVQGAVSAAVTRVTGEDGTLAKSVKAVVTEAIKPLKDEVDLLAKEVRGKEAAEEAVMQTIQKGGPYEELVVADLQPFAKSIGAEVHHVGADNRPGDVVLKLNGTSVSGSEFTLVIEARDRQSAKGRRAINDDMTKKMAERNADTGIYLSKSIDGLGNEIGDWAEGENGHGPWIATTHQNLLTAVRFAIAMHRLRTIRSDTPAFDGTAVENQVQRIRTSLGRITKIRRKVTDVCTAAEFIKTEAGEMQDEIRDALNSIDDAIRLAPSTEDQD